MTVASVTMDGDVLHAASSDFISLGDLFCKASPAEEGGRRMLYLEASNESKDHQKERILQSALADSRDFFLRHGNIDISHYTLIGLKHNIPNHMEYEIGKPREVGFHKDKTFVKSELYQGESAQARNASMVWDSLTKQRPPMSWFPSVGGGILKRDPAVDPETGEKVMVVKQVRWCNIGLDRTPVNMTVPEVSLTPIGTFAKSMGAIVTFAKTLTAGYGTDSATLSGGAALRKQSLHGAIHNYFVFRDEIARHLLAHRGQNLGSHELIDHSINVLQLSPNTANEWVGRFMRDLHNTLHQRSAAS